MNHEINMTNFNIRTDLAIEKIKDNNLIEEEIDNIKISTIKTDKEYITIEFKDITDYNNSKKLEKIFITKLRKILKENNIKENSTCLVIGLGNEKSTPDSLGPLTINNIIVTNHFYQLGIDVEEGFRSVAAIKPNVMGQTGIETSDMIEAIVNKIKPDFILVIDSLKASKVDRLNKTVQITDSGINPGSGIGNNRKEISKEILGIPVIAIGVPTVVDTITIVNESINHISNYYSYMKNNIDSPKEKLKIIRTNFINNDINIEDKKELFGLFGTLTQEEEKQFISEVLLPIGYNMIVTPKDIDFQIEKISELISNGINNVLHKNVTHL